MAERPDLEYQLPLLDRALEGKRIVAVLVEKPIVLRLAIEGTPQALLEGRTFAGVSRRGHFAIFELGDVQMIVAPMLAGRFLFLEEKQKAPADTAMLWTLSDRTRLCYRDDVQMGKVYIVTKGAWDVVPGLKTIGIDVLSPAFTFAHFEKLCSKRRDQVRVFLMDKSALDAFGNAYADEVLWAAKIHPKTMVKKLGEGERRALHEAIVSVTKEAIGTIAQRKPPLDEKLRDFLKVRNRHGEPCPRCGTKIRKAGVHGHDTFFCPECQPETRKTSIVDWRK
ncbi:MAG: endonuclease VIII [Deltaproteobacteria bacterium]|nr:endonuclease VIII [Deltaproteobacteria bacterium]